MEIVETADEKTPDNASEAEGELIRTKEAQRIDESYGEADRPDIAVLPFR